MQTLFLLPSPLLTVFLRHRYPNATSNGIRNMTEDSREPFECPIRPDLRCVEHECVLELLHSLLGRLMVLESRVARLEEE